MSEFWCEKCSTRYEENCTCGDVRESVVLPGSTPGEYKLMDQLATMVGVSAPESEEERNMSSLYKRRVLKKAIKALTDAWRN